MKPIRKTKRGGTYRCFANSKLNPRGTCNLISRFDEILRKYARVQYEFSVWKSYTKHLYKQLEILETNALDSSQYLRKEMIEINPVIEDIEDTQLEEAIRKALSFDAIVVSLYDLEVSAKTWLFVQVPCVKSRLVINKQSSISCGLYKSQIHSQYNHLNFALVICISDKFFLKKMHQ